MDITVNVGEYILNMRAAGIIQQNGQILFHKNKNKLHHCLIGGRIKIGEDSITAVKREILEKIGEKVEVINVIAIVENFFEMNNKKYHEILFVHEIEFLNEESRRTNKQYLGLEQKENLQYKWINTEKLDDIQILPQNIKEILKNKDNTVHRIRK